MAADLTVVVIAPHPDDEAIGCGGAMRLRSDEGRRVVTVFLTSGELGVPQLSVDEARALREREAEKAAAVLGSSDIVFLRLEERREGLDVRAAAAALAPVLERERPERIYVPHEGESHPDHAAAIPAVRAALAPSGQTPHLFTYEVWNPMTAPDYVEDVTRVMTTKLRAIRTYQSQLTAFRYDHAIRGLNRYRGELGARTRFAEAYAWADPVGGGS